MQGDRARRHRSPVALALLGGAGLVVFAVLIALGTWQVERRTWKLDLIARVDARVHAAPVAAPGPADWPSISAERDGYRHVRVRGTFLNDRETQVFASTALGNGYWVLTPLRTDAGWTVLVNRGFVPTEQRQPATRPGSQVGGETDVTGLLRPSEPEGTLLRSNRPGEDRWYSRDVAAIAQARGLSGVAPYFIDADATSNPGKLPVGGLTQIHFRNSHLVYALTWYGLALLVVVGAVVVVRDERKRRREEGGPPVP